MAVQSREIFDISEEGNSSDSADEVEIAASSNHTASAPASTLPHAPRLPDRSKRDRGDRHGVKRSVDTCIMAFHCGDIHQAGKRLVLAPTANSNPIGFKGDRLPDNLFPLLRCGLAGITNDDRDQQGLLRVSFIDKTKNEFYNKDRRALADAAYVFWCLMKYQIMRVTYAATMAVRKLQVDGRPLTARDVKSRPNQEYLQNKDLLFNHLRKFKGTNDYMSECRKSCNAMLRQLGTPAFFFTLTSRGRMWPELIRALSLIVDSKHLTDEEIRDLPKEEARRLIRTDASTCSRMYSKRLDNYLRLLSVDHRIMGGMVAFFTKEEWQRGGDEHTHGIAWVKDAPTYIPHGDNSEVIKFIDTHVTCSAFMLPRSLLQAQIHGHVKLTCQKKQRKKHVCRFNFPRYPMRCTVILLGFPEDEDDSEYLSEEEIAVHTAVRLRIEALMEAMQDKAIEYDPRGKYNKDTDTFSPVPPLRTATNIAPPPLDPRLADGYWHSYWLEHLGITEEAYILAIRSGLSRPTVCLKRKFWEMCVNNYGRHMAELWNSNTDIQFVLEPYAAVTYICAYINKVQKGVCELMDRLQAMLHAVPNTSLYKALQEIGRKHIVTQQVSPLPICGSALKVVSPICRACFGSSFGVLGVFRLLSVQNRYCLVLYSKFAIRTLKKAQFDVGTLNLRLF